MKTDLVRIHHAAYVDDIPFWRSLTEGRDPVLEVGCGHGRVALPLLTTGRDLVGVDIDLPSIQYLRTFLDEVEPELWENAQIVHEDILSFQTDRTFGAVIIPCNTYSAFPGDERLLILARIFRLLKKGGIFAVSMPNPVRVFSFWEELVANQEQDNLDLETIIIHPDTGFPVQVSSRLSALKESLGWDRIYDHLHPDGRVERVIQSTEHYLASLDTYLKEFDEVGFFSVQSMGDYDESPYSGVSPDLILVGTK